MLVTAPLTLWSGQGSSWHFVLVPPGQSHEIRAHASATPRGFRSVRVDAAIGEARWRTSVFPHKSGGYLLPVKAAVRRQINCAAGDEVTVSLEFVPG
jgi:hypothetical protein